MGFAYGKYTTHFASTRPDENDSYELMLEANYRFYLTQWCYVMPNIQVILNPKGGKHSDALVLGAQVGVMF